MGGVTASKGSSCNQFRVAITFITNTSLPEVSTLCPQAHNRSLGASNHHRRWDVCVANLDSGETHSALLPGLTSTDQRRLSGAPPVKQRVATACSNVAAVGCKRCMHCSGRAARAGIGRRSERSVRGRRRSSRCSGGGQRGLGQPQPTAAVADQCPSAVAALSARRQASHADAGAGADAATGSALCPLPAANAAASSSPARSARPPTAKTATAAIATAPTTTVSASAEPSSNPTAVTQPAAITTLTATAAASSAATAAATCVRWHTRDVPTLGSLSPRVSFVPVLSLSGEL